MNHKLAKNAGIRAVRVNETKVEVFDDQRTLVCTKISEFCWEVKEGDRLVSKEATEQGAANSAFWEIFG